MRLPLKSSSVLFSAPLGFGPLFSGLGPFYDTFVSSGTFTLFFSKSVADEGLNTEMLIITFYNMSKKVLHDITSNYI